MDIHAEFVPILGFAIGWQPGIIAILIPFVGIEISY